MGCNFHEEDIKPIEVYVELSGKEKYHESLKGRSERDQHPISAITNLQENLEDISQEFDNVREEQAQSTEELESLISQTEQQLTNRIDTVEEKVDDIDLTQYYTKVETDQKLETTVDYKGSVTNYDFLPTVDVKVGDMYNTLDTGFNYVWTGTDWDNLSPLICLKKYATKEYVDTSISTSIDLIEDYIDENYYNKDDIEGIVSNIDTEIEDLRTTVEESTQWHGIMD